MTAKQSPGVYAPDGSLYITLTDGNGSLAAAGGPGTASTTEMLYNNAGTIDGVSGWTTNGTTTLVGGASTTLSIGGGTALTTSNQTGTGNIVLATSPSLVTPALGIATGTTLALGGATISTNALAVTGTASLSGSVTLTSPTANFLTGGYLAIGDGGTSSPKGSIYSSTSVSGSYILFGKADTSNVNTAIGTLGAANPGVTVSDIASFGFASAADPSGVRDTQISRDAANTLALRNGTAAQTFNVYNTYTDASNYERAVFGWNSNRLDIGPQAAGTGTLRSIGILSHLLFPTDNTYDIGASGATRPRSIYFANVIIGPTFTATAAINIGLNSGLTWAGTRSYVDSSADGVIRLANNAATNFSRLQFGGTTSSFPALKRSTTRLQHVLADDSAYAGVDASDIGLIGTSGSKLEVLTLTELTTIAAAATTDTTIQIPANAILLAVQVRTTTVIPTAATYTVIGAGSATAFNTAAVSAAATSTDPGTAAGAYYNATAQAIRITPNATPADNTGRVRVTIRYILSTPPTS